MRNLFLVATLALAMSSTAAFGQGAAASKQNAALKNPASLKEKAPETYKAKFVTTKGPFIVEVKRAWSPNGADRFYNLVKSGYFEKVKFFRVVPGFVVQFGIHPDPAISAKWRDANIQDDKVTQSNKKGFLTFATAGPNTRTTQLFISLADNERLDGMGFSAFGHVITGMDVVEKLYNGYGEQPDQRAIQEQGNTYLDKEWPKLDSIIKATIIK